jgi:hypothetical protein
MKSVTLEFAIRFDIEHSYSELAAGCFIDWECLSQRQIKKKHMQFFSNTLQGLPNRITVFDSGITSGFWSRCVHPSY